MFIRITTISPLLLLTALLLTGVAKSSQAQEWHDQPPPVCGPEVKQAFADALDAAGYHKNPFAEESVALKKTLFEKFAYCAEYQYSGSDGYAGKPIDSDDEYCGRLSFVASTAYERMPCCGYDPQKKQFACPIEITLPYGFNAAPFPGSYEYVLSCVDFGAGMVPVARDRVHLADELFGNNPSWYFAVIADARAALRAAPLLGQTLQARSILSWNTMPSSCSDSSIVWGNAIDYQIRLDP